MVAMAESNCADGLYDDNDGQVDCLGHDRMQSPVCTEYTAAITLMTM